MPIIKSAKKRVKVARKATARNAITKRTLRDALKAFSKAMSGGKPAEIAKAEKAVMSAIDVAAKKAIIHKNKASRKKSRLAAQAKASGFKPSKGTPPKAPAKKPAAKKSAKIQTAKPTK